MADAILGTQSVPIPINYVHEPRKLITYERTLDGSIIINYAVTSGDVAVTKYHFELNGITVSERIGIRNEFLKSGSLTFKDLITIPEVFSHDGTTGAMALQRQLGSTDTSNIIVAVDGETQIVTITTGTNPTTGNTYITTGGVMTFSTDTAAGTNNIRVDYIPLYTVVYSEDENQFLQKNSAGSYIAKYNVILEEV